MIEQNTVFVLGAGASKPYGFPVGAELHKLICGRRRDDTYSLPKRFQDTNFSVTEVEQFVRAFERSGQPSIDAFIEARQEFDWIGRCAIAEFLCEHEDPNVAFNPNTEGNWYKALWRDMTNPDGNPNTAASNVKFLTFNYDRSLEHFFFTAAKHTFRIADEGAYQFLKTIAIQHVYGELGEFHYLPGDYRRQYSKNPAGREVDTAANGIHLIGAGRKDAGPFQKARDWFKQANVICFLGFGFDPTNVERLGLEDAIRERLRDGGTSKLIIASTLGKTQAQVDRIKSQLCPSASLWKHYNADNLGTLASAGLVR